MKALAFLARRFVAGETADGAIAAGRRLAAKGIRSTFDLLGEDVLDQAAARRFADANRQLLRLIPPEVDRNISIKLTSLGLDISREFCQEQAAGILDVARAVQGFVRIDMEGSRHTQPCLEVFRALRRSYDNVGIVLQAYLHRTERDVEEAVERGDRVRLCKGAYKEPDTIAWTDMDQIRASFRRCASLLLQKGNSPALATHDEGLIQAVLSLAREHAVPATRYELQMLYGLRRKRWEELVAAGHNMRVYIPYGTHWMPYFYRRLRERKENVFFVVRSLFED